MDRIKIKNKMYAVNVSIGRIQKATKLLKLDTKEEEDEKNEKEKSEDYIDNTIDALWIYLKRRFYGFKPFITKERMKDNISTRDLLKIDKDLAGFMAVEDRNGGNLPSED